MAGKKGCGGKKGRSGRRPLSVGDRRRAIIDRARDIVDEGLSSNLPLKTRMVEASKLAVKDMPTEIIGDLNHVVSMPVIQKASGEASIKLEFNIGAPHTTEDTGHPSEAPTAD